MALSELRHRAVGVLAVDQRQVDIGRYLPAERFIQQVVLRRGAQVLRAADDVGDGHGVVVDDVREVVGRVAVLLDQDLVLQLAVLDRDLAEYRVREGRRALGRHLLADNIGDARVQILLYLLVAEVAAVAVIAAADGLFLELFEPLLGAEAAVRLALFDELFGVGQVHILSLALHIGAVVAADVGAFVVDKSRGFQGVVDNVYRAFYISFLIGVLNTQDEGAALTFRYQIFIQRRSQVADVHEARRTGRESCSYFTHSDIPRRSVCDIFCISCPSRTSRGRWARAFSSY